MGCAMTCSLLLAVGCAAAVATGHSVLAAVVGVLLALSGVLLGVSVVEARRARAVLAVHGDRLVATIGGDATRQQHRIRTTRAGVDVVIVMHREGRERRRPEWSLSIVHKSDHPPFDLRWRDGALDEVDLPRDEPPGIRDYIATRGVIPVRRVHSFAQLVQTDTDPVELERLYGSAVEVMEWVERLLAIAGPRDRSDQ